MKPLEGRRVKAVCGMGPGIMANAAGCGRVTVRLFVMALMTDGDHPGLVMG